MERITSNGGVVFAQDGYLYTLNKYDHGIYYVKCAISECPSRGSFPDGVNILTIHSPHIHEPDVVEVEVRKLKIELKREATTSQRSPRDLFNEVCQRYPRAAARLGFPSVRSTIYRHRRMGQPPIPHSLSALAETLLSEDWAHLANDSEGHPFFRGLLGGNEEGWEAVAYISSRLGTALSGTTRLHVDATFKTVPTELQAYQLLTIHGEYMHHLFPVAFFVMDRKTQGAYQGVFSFFKTQLPGLNPTVILSDFELAMQNAAALVWPNARLVGCFFHYSQAVYRKMLELHMLATMQRSLEADKASHMLMALALLPADMIATGVEVIRYYLTQNHLEADFQQILEYIDNYWLSTIGVNTMSVANEPHRTNNALEGFYSRLIKLMGPHPSAWAFHGHVRDIERSQWLDYSRMATGVRHVRPLRREYARQNTRVFEATRHLIEGRYNVAEFLSQVAHLTKSMTTRLRIRNQVNIDPEVEAHPPPAEALAAEPMMLPQVQLADLATAGAPQPHVAPQPVNVAHQEVQLADLVAAGAPQPQIDIVNVVNVAHEVPRGDRRGQRRGGARRGGGRGQGGREVGGRGGRGRGGRMVQLAGLATAGAPQPHVAPQPANVAHEEVDPEMPPIPALHPAPGPARRSRRGRGHPQHHRRHQVANVVGAAAAGGAPAALAAQEAQMDFEDPFWAGYIEDNLRNENHPYWHRYRTTPTQYEDLLPVQAIAVQAEELAEALHFGPAEEPSVEAAEGQPTCFICMANTPTRMAIPCGHNIVCRECLPHFINQVGYHRVLTPGGQVVETNFRLPITCPNCRAIVGQVIPTYL